MCGGLRKPPKCTLDYAVFENRGALTLDRGSSAPRLFVFSRRPDATSSQHAVDLRREFRCSGGAVRGGRKLVATGQEMVGLAGVGPADRQSVEHVVRDRRVRDRRGGAQACRHPARDVGQ